MKELQMIMYWSLRITFTRRKQLFSLHKKWSFPLGISSVNVTKSALLRIWSQLMEKFNMENFIFCAVSCENSKWLKTVIFFKTLHHQKAKRCLTMSQIHICRLKLLSTVLYIDSYFDMSTGILKKKKDPLETYYSYKLPFAEVFSR